MSRVGIGAVLLGLSFGYAAGVVGPAAAPVSRDFGVSLSAAGLMTSIFFIAIAVFALVATPVEERLGVPWSARLGAVLLGIGCALSAVSPWFALMLVGRGLAGLGTGLVFIAAPVIIRALRSAVLLGSYGGGITFGLAASLFIGGVLAENGVDWRVNFLIAAAIGFSSLVFLFGRMPEIARISRRWRSTAPLLSRRSRSSLLRSASAPRTRSRMSGSKTWSRGTPSSGSRSPSRASTWSRSSSCR
jgi:MFS family permease